jgi:hypothetical protein
MKTEEWPCGDRTRAELAEASSSRTTKTKAGRAIQKSGWWDCRKIGAATQEVAVSFNSITLLGGIASLCIEIGLLQCTKEKPRRDPDSSSAVLADTRSRVRERSGMMRGLTNSVRALICLAIFSFFK